jgi:hypothetical protein
MTAGLAAPYRMNADKTPEQCVLEWARNKELVAQFERLTGVNLQLRGASIELMVDEAPRKRIENAFKLRGIVGALLAASSR